MPYGREDQNKTLAFRKQIEEGLASGKFTREDLENHLKSTAGQNTGGIGIGAQQPSLANRLTGAADVASNIFLQQGGLTPPEKTKSPSSIDELVKLQTAQLSNQIKEQQADIASKKEQREQMKFEAEQIKTTTEAAEKAKSEKAEATKRATISGSIPTEASLQTGVAPQEISSAAQPVSVGTTEAGIGQPAGQPAGQLALTGASIKTGGITEKFENIQSEINKTIDLDRVKQGLTVDTGKRLSINNLAKVGQNLNNVATSAAKAYRAGQAGDSVAAARTRAVGSRYGNIPVPGTGKTTQELYGEEGAELEGVLAEALFPMIPMLTQQGEKPGSVRLMSTVINRLGLTLPKLETSPGAARNMLAASTRSFFKFARAAELNGLEFDGQFEGRAIADIPDTELDAWVNNVKSLTGNVNLSESEQKALEDLTSEILKPIDDVIYERKHGKQKLEVMSIEQVEG